MPENVPNFQYRAAKWLRRRAGWLLALALLALWPLVQGWLYTYTLQLLPDAQSAAAQTAFLPLGNPLSKILLTLAVAALGYAFMWLGMRLFQPALHRWAKAEFKSAFYALPYKWQLALFASFWLGSLFFFALIWVGASLVA
jgi:hypothetical protein